MNKDRFWAKVDKSETFDECWPWQGVVMGGGYGGFYVAGKMVGAHRVAYELCIGPITSGLFVCHKCDFKLCVNPKHLFLGIQKDNIADMISKNRGRCRKGEAHPAHKITEQQVKEIRSDNASTQEELAKKFDIDQGTVSSIKLRKTWKHVSITCILLCCCLVLHASTKGLINNMVGVASYYSNAHHGKLQANGRPFNMHAFTCAHRTLPLGTKIRVVNLATNKHIILIVTDRGPYRKGRILDVSYAAAKRLGMVKPGLALVRVEVINVSRG
jgi:rare lipoprotein A (peptidoglycan hydrolase)